MTVSVLGATLLFATNSSAIVEQTDGLVVPVQVANCPGSGTPDGCIQVGLNIGEGFAATAANNPLNATFDAVTSPEVFSIPKNNGVFGNVKVDDLIEGAGYENTFGWYNVDDPNKLYAITPCADEPGSSKTVNFQTEFTAGRYLGGFIGFFLITPETAPIGNNCGAINNVGYLYYTEQAKNGDGNYVHYLLYKSKKDPLVFYFGFEDLYRGGDNDFEDMFVKVTGLLAPCTPSAEICDNKDNNCDGLVDNNPVDAGGECGATDVGECSYGTFVCQGGALVCSGYKGPVPELCNGLDDDCDSMTDENAAGAGMVCGNDTGECSYGAQQCIGGVLVCLGGKGTALETCNSKDDDCNGVTDDKTIDSGGPCGSNVGACKPGVFTCNNGMIECVGAMAGTPEVCNGIDDDCNGAIDDGDPGGGGMCGQSAGACEPGVEHCVGGVIICVGGVGPSDEICDGQDNDCDGNNDNLATCPGNTKCVEGTCASPCGSGEFSCPGGQVCVEGYCVAGSCENVTCPTGQSCVQGVCVNDGAGGAGGGAGGGSAGGGEPSSSSTGTGASGSSTSTSATGAGGASSGEDADHWGQSTGGGGLKCSVDTRPEPQRHASALALLLGAIALAFRRRSARSSSPGGDGRRPSSRSSRGAAGRRAS